MCCSCIYILWQPFPPTYVLVWMDPSVFFFHDCTLICIFPLEVYISIIKYICQVVEDHITGLICEINIVSVMWLWTIITFTRSWRPCKCGASALWDEIPSICWAYPSWPSINSTLLTANSRATLNLYSCLKFWAL